MNAELDEQLREEWRDLGFFYDVDRAKKEWLLVGSRAGLLRFAERLRRYVEEAGRTAVSEHEHFWPYGYLEVMTSTKAGMDDHSIHGTIADLGRLADIIDRSIALVGPGSQVRLREEYAADSEYSLVLDVRVDDFDPVSADPGLKGAD